MQEYKIVITMTDNRTIVKRFASHPKTLLNNAEKRANDFLRISIVKDVYCIV